MDPRIKALPRHERLPDLLAASEDLHPRKTRRIEFIGDKNPLDDERVQANILLGRYTPTQTLAIRRAATRAVVRIQKFSERLMEHDHQHSMAVNRHLSRTYRWHAGNNYIENVDFVDVDAILGGPSGHQFRDLDGEEEALDNGHAVAWPKITKLSPEVFKLIAVDAIARNDTRIHRGDVVARH